MSTIKCFEDLDCRKEARILVNMIYHLTKNNEFQKDYELKDQIRRASTSSMTNIAEGFARFSTKDRIRFMDFAQSSCEEVKNLLYVALDLNYITEKEQQETYKKAADVRNLTLAFIKYLRRYDSQHK